MFPNLPAGWYVEPGDPTTGVYGPTFFHTECEGEINDCADETWETTGERGEGVNHEIITKITLKCPDCGKIDSFEFIEFDPIYPDDED